MICGSKNLNTTYFVFCLRLINTIRSMILYYTILILNLLLSESCMLLFFSHYYIFTIPVKNSLHSQSLKRKCHIALSHILTQHCSRSSYIAETSMHRRLGSVYVWCLVTKRSMSWEREREREVFRKGERGREGQL